MTRRAGLAGCRVAVTRPDASGDELSELLEAAGAVAVSVPLVAIVAAADDTPLRAAAAGLSGYDWVVFTSANGVRRLAEALAAAGRTPADLAGAVAAVGPATAREVEAVLGWRVDALPDSYTGSALTAAMERHGAVAGRRVLWPRAEAAREELGRDLEAAGAVLDDPVAYRTTGQPAAATRLAGMLERSEIDVVILTSPSAAECLAAARPRTSDAVVCVIGPSTARAARRAGLPVHVEPTHHTIPALVERLRQHLDR